MIFKLFLVLFIDDLSPALDSYLEPLGAKQKSSIQDASADRSVLENMPSAAKLQKLGFL